MNVLLAAVFFVTTLATFAAFHAGRRVERALTRKHYQPLIDRLHDNLDEARIAAVPTWRPDRSARLRLP